MKHSTKFWRLRQGLLPILLGVLAVGGLLFETQQASAADSGPTVTGDICMQKVFGTPVTNSNRLNCTANDIRLSRAISVSPESCIEGSFIDLTATFETIVTANSRYDAGFFFRIDGGANARGDGSNASGTCSLSALTPPPPANPPVLGLDGDTCGDLNAGTYEVTFTIPNVRCTGVEVNGERVLKLPNCTSWHSNQGTACDISNPFSTSDVVDFHPDTKSKCVCDDNFTVPVIVEEAKLNVVKLVAPSSVPESGGTVTYTVQISNEADFVSVTIDSILDSEYGDLGDADNQNVTENTCDDLIGDVLAPGGSTSCSFKAFVSGDSGDTVPDTVHVCGTDSGQNEACGEASAEVTITNESEEPTLTKTVQAAACSVDVTYQVVVSNSSTIDTLTVNALADDKFGDITTAHPAGGGFAQVVSTNCQTGGTVAKSDNYTCSFVGRITSNSCNFVHTDTVTGTVTDDDNVQSSPSDSATVTVTTTF
jgi:hypothetical protein